jgi:hypothetical protein
MCERFDVACINGIHLRNKVEYFAELLSKPRNVVVIDLDPRESRYCLYFVVTYRHSIPIIY